MIAERLIERPVEWSREQIAEQIDAEARRRLGISGASLLEAYRSGKLDDPGLVADLIVLADLLEEAGAADAA